MKETNKNKRNELQIELEETNFKAMKRQWLMLNKTNNRGETSLTELGV